jgi:hypothetical protein
MRARAVRRLTEREQALLATVQQFRILDGRQIQSIFFPDGTLVGSRRRTQSCLKRLVDEHYLQRLERRVGGVRAGSASFIYCLGPKGQRFARPDHRARRRGEPGLAFVGHHLAVAQIYVDLITAERDGDLEVIEHQPEPDCWRPLTQPFGGMAWLKPDLFVSLGVGDYELRWFVEADMGTESLRRIELACDRYGAHYRSGVEQAEHEVFPRVAWLASTTRRAEAIAGVIARRSESEQGLFVVGLLSASNHILKGGENETKA